MAQVQDIVQGRVRGLEERHLLGLPQVPALVQNLLPVVAPNVDRVLLALLLEVLLVGVLLPEHGLV